MKKLTIHQNDTQNIELIDDSDEPLDEYCVRLSHVMKMGNITILKTSSASVVLRPSKVVGIKVEDGASSEVKTPQIIPPEESKAKPNISEDIITDVDS